MLKFFRNRLDKKGFTLVELLVVIAVLGIIAGIAIPRMSGVTDTFRIRADEETARNLARTVQIRVQSGITDVPVSGSPVRILLTAGSGDKLGEDFTKKPQYSSEFNSKNRIFVITLTNSEVLIYNCPDSTADTAKPITAPSDSRELFKLTHGGKIE